jgi:hypothetical protein
MLNLKLRDEFLGVDMRETTIAFHRDDQTGALDIDPEAFFTITYPSIDLQKALLAIGEKGEGRPIVLLGERGRGKSHIMAAMHHALKAPTVVEQWAQDWVNQSAAELLMSLRLQRGCEPVTVNLNDHDYKFLWEVLFKHHPAGQRFLGRFEALRQHVPPKDLIVEMLKAQPVALLLDELQTWYDGTVDEPGNSGNKYRSWAFSFLQMLSEIATEYPEHLVLIVSVRNTHTDAFSQLRRNNPRLIDFLTPAARRDRQRLILHRLFENRRFIPEPEVRSLTAAYRQERFRLIRSSQDAGSEQVSDLEVLEAWPFAPELLDVLEDQILPSSQAQGLRDLLRILALVYRDASPLFPLITPADFTIEEVKNEAVNSLLNAIVDSGQFKLYDIAVSNLKAVQQAGIVAPHLGQMMGALWMRSFSIATKRGASARQLHLDITHEQSIDDNLFDDELGQVVTHSFNIHSDNVGGELQYFFKEEENPRSRLLASARNDSLFADFRDRDYIRKVLKADLTPESKVSVAQVIVLGPNWQTSPWSEVEASERPEKWESPILLVLPDAPLDLHGELGKWLKAFVPQKRNTVRFLLPKTGATSLYRDPDVFLNARAALLADEWKKPYQAVGRDFLKQLHEAFENRFDRYAVLRSWDFQQPTNCTFLVGQVSKKVADIARTIDEKLKDDHFELEAFEQLVHALATQFKDVNALLQELREPPASPQRNALVYLGEKEISEQLCHLVAEDKLALLVKGEWVKRESETEQGALHRIRAKAFKQGRELAEIGLRLPNMGGGHATGTAPTQIPARPIQPYQPSTVSTPPIQKSPEELPLDLWSSPAANDTDNSAYSPFSRSAGTSSSAEAHASYSTTSAAPEAASAHGIPSKRRSEPELSLKLISQLEKWGLAANETVSVARLEFTDITIAELKRVLQKLPHRAILEIEFDER